MNKMGKQLRSISDITLPLSSTCLCIHVHTHLFMDVLRLIKKHALYIHAPIHSYTHIFKTGFHAHMHAMTKKNKKEKKMSSL